MDHMKKNWDLEIMTVRETARNQKVELSNHAEQQMKDRGLDPLTLLAASPMLLPCVMLMVL